MGINGKKQTEPKQFKIPPKLYKMARETGGLLLGPQSLFKLRQIMYKKGGGPMGSYITDERIKNEIRELADKIYDEQKFEFEEWT